MKKQIVKRFFKNYFSTEKHDFELSGHLIFRLNNELLLQGLHFESSAFNRNSFTINVFTQPLYIPDNTINLNFGKRLGYIVKNHDFWWQYDETQEDALFYELDNLTKKYAIPFLDKGSTIEKFLHQNGKIKLNDNKYMVETIAYTYILTKEIQKSKKMLSLFDVLLKKEIDENPNILWLNETQKRTQRILFYLENQEYDQAKAQLFEWAAETRKALKI